MQVAKGKRRTNVDYLCFSGRFNQKMIASRTILKMINQNIKEGVTWSIFKMTVMADKTKIMINCGQLLEMNLLSR